MTKRTTGLDQALRVYLEGLTPKLFDDHLTAVSRANNVNPRRRHINRGIRRMQIANDLRSKLSRGEPVRIGDKLYRVTH